MKATPLTIRLAFSQLVLTQSALSFWHEGNAAEARPFISLEEFSIVNLYNNSWEFSKLSSQVSSSHLRSEQEKLPSFLTSGGIVKVFSVLDYKTELVLFCLALNN